MRNERVNEAVPDRLENGPLSKPSLALPDINAETYPFEAVEELLDQAAFFNLFSVPDAGCSKAVRSTTGHCEGVIGLRVGEILHRLEITVRLPALDTGLRAINRMGEPLGRFDHRWMFIPDNFLALPGVEPPATLLDPSRSQRFAMLDGICSLNGGRDGFRGFGTGVTYPMRVNGQSKLLAAAVGSILEGFGKFKGHEGTYTYCGSLSPNQGFSGNFLCRVIDAAGVLRTEGSLPPLEAYSDPDPEATYIILRGQKKDKHQETSYNIGPDGDVKGLNVAQQLRVVRLDSASPWRGGLQSIMSKGPAIGEMSAKILFNILHPTAPGTALSPIPFQSYNEYSFVDRDGRTVGSITANGSEGRTFNMRLPGAPGQAALRFGGFGPIVKGTGQFEDVSGIMTDNSVVGVAPHALSTLYVLRINDPDGKYREAFSNAKDSFHCECS